MKWSQTTHTRFDIAFVVNAAGSVITPLLNNDTVPQPGWLDALLDTFARFPGTGLAGAQLLYPDGRLQEAGGVVFADGSAWNLGRFESPDDPRFGYVREADYVSGAALAPLRSRMASLRRARAVALSPAAAANAPAW